MGFLDRKNKGTGSGNDSVTRETTNEPLDALADMLRVVSRYSFPLPDEEDGGFHSACEAWREHLLLGRNLDGSMPAPEGDGPLLRNWKGLRDFLGQRRQAEAAYVQKLLRTSTIALADLQSEVTRERAAMALQSQQVNQRLNDLDTLLQDGAAKNEHLEQARRSLSALQQQLTSGNAIQSEHQSRSLETLGSFRQTLEGMASHEGVDPLTRLHTSFAFQTHFEFVSSLIIDSNESVIIARIDVEKLEAVNAQYGHETGDKALRAVADTIVRTFPRRHDYIARSTGSEFTALLRDLDCRTAQRLMTRLLKAKVVSLRDDMPRGMKVRLSVGFTQLVPGERLSETLGRAQQALRRSKHLDAKEACFLAPNS